MYSNFPLKFSAYFLAVGFLSTQGFATNQKDMEDFSTSSSHIISNNNNININPTLLSLPDEILVHILKNLSGKELGQIAPVCKKINALLPEFTQYLQRRGEVLLAECMKVVNAAVEEKWTTITEFRWEDFSSFAKGKMLEAIESNRTAATFKIFENLGDKGRTSLMEYYKKHREASALYNRFRAKFTDAGLGKEMEKIAVDTAGSQVREAIVFYSLAKKSGSETAQGKIDLLINGFEKNFENWPTLAKTWLEDFQRNL